jgi:hypothetical protein
MEKMSPRKKMSVTLIDNKRDSKVRFDESIANSKISQPEQRV